MSFVTTNDATHFRPYNGAQQSAILCSDWTTVFVSIGATNELSFVATFSAANDTTIRPTHAGT